MTIPTELQQAPYGIAITGRIKDWLSNPESRLPVSCTVFVVEDSMEGENGIEHSWNFTSKGLRNAAGVAIHLSKLRPSGTDNNRGLVSSGPVSFSKIYSILNEVLRRGGTFRNGAISLHIDYDHPDAADFVEMPRRDIPWAKRCLNIDENFLNHPQLQSFLTAIRKGDLFIVKKQYDKKGERIYHNVCQEILLRHRDTCLLSHVNLGLVQNDEVESTFVNGMKWLCELHAYTGVGEDNDYLPAKDSNQVGLGVLGLANALAIRTITYEEFVYALSDVVGYKHSLINRDNLDIDGYNFARAFAQELYNGFHEAAKVAKEHGMERAFTVAPTASCSFKHKDAHDYVTSPEIAPPISAMVERDSSTNAVVTADYHPMTEIAIDVDPQVYLELNAAWQTMMDSTGLGHAMSTNWWSDAMDLDKLIKWWVTSPLKSLYYSWRIMPDTQNKASILSPTSMGMTHQVDEEEEVVDGFCPIDGSCLSCAE